MANESALAPAPSHDAQVGTPVRARDNLLGRPDLQALVDAGLRRDVGTLLRSLAGPDAIVRARAAAVLAWIEDSTTRLPLESHLADPDVRVRDDAAFALGQLKDARSADALLRTLAGEQAASTRYLLLEALGKCGDQRVLAQLLERPLREEDRGGMTVALGGFGRRGIGSARAGTLLLDLIAPSEGDLAELAALALAAPRSPEVWGVSGDRFRGTLAHLPRESAAAAPLLGMLRAGSSSAGAPMLGGWLDSATNWRTRVAAARALAPWAGRAETRARLFRALDDPSIHVAVTAAQVLAAAAPPAPREMEAWSAWIRRNGARWQVSVALMPALAAAGDETFILNWVGDPDRPGIPPWAAYPVLATLRNPKALEWLLSGLNSQDRRRGYIASAALARRLANDSVPSAEVDRIAVVLERRLSSWGPTAPGSDVQGVLALLKALQARGGPAAAALVRRAAAHPHPRIRESARQLLGETTADAPAMPSASVDWIRLARLGSHPRVRVETDRGAFVLELDPEAAPQAVAAFARYVEEGRYDDVLFHRVEAAFILQSGDFDNGAGSGGPMRAMPSEFNRVPFRHGTLGMASAGKDTEGSQYFVTHGRSTSLDGRYTAFGRVVEGIAAADAVALGERVRTARILRPRI